MYYEPRSIVYIFKVAAESERELQEKLSKLINWLTIPNSNTNTYNDCIYDSSLGDWHLENCICTEIKTENAEYANINSAYLTANFIAYPFLKNSLGGERL